MTAGPMRRRWQEVLVVVGVVAVLVAMVWPEIEAFRVQPAARRELLAFTSELALDMPHSEVVGKIGQRGRVHLTVDDLRPDLVLVRTPYTFGAGNWLAWLDFTRGRLSSVRIRTTDGEHIKPAGSPPDVGVPPPR
jgi:hypothetical protein